jgi:hypothetical protein
VLTLLAKTNRRRYQRLIEFFSTTCKANWRAGYGSNQQTPIGRDGIGQERRQANDERHGLTPYLGQPLFSGFGLVSINRISFPRPISRSWPPSCKSGVGLARADVQRSIRGLIFAAGNPDRERRILWALGSRSPGGSRSGGMRCTRRLGQRRPWYMRLYPWP